MTTTSKRGFTLIELLVVIAIIGILAAILFPVFARAREQARKTSCASNLKQIGLAMLQYRQDYDEKFPRFGNVDEGKLGWAEKLNPYLKSVEIFQCPSEAQSQVLPARYTDYFMGTDLFEDLTGVSEATIEFPSNTISNGETRYGKSDLYCTALRSVGPTGVSPATRVMVLATTTFNSPMFTPICAVIPTVPTACSSMATSNGCVPKRPSSSISPTPNSPLRTPSAFASANPTLQSSKRAASTCSAL